MALFLDHHARKLYHFLYLMESPMCLLIKLDSFLTRYSVKVALVQPITIQVRTSKPDAFIKLQVLENEETMVSSTGKGQAIIPAFTFLGNEKSVSFQCKCVFLSWVFGLINKHLLCDILKCFKLK